MSVLPPQSSTLTIAKESLAMSERTGDKSFQRMAIGFMALTGLGTLLHAIHEICRDMQPRRGKVQVAAVEILPAPATPPERAVHRHEAIPAEGWVNRTRSEERHPEGGRAWVEAVARKARGGQLEK